MPKVSAEYFEKKRNALLDAVEKICQNKPLYLLTMQDIVKEAGLSFGAVYDSFPDIDAVIAALICRLRVSVDFQSDTENLLRAENSPEEKLRALFRYYLEFARNTIDIFGKIHYEMGTVITDERRREKILNGIGDKTPFVYGLDAAVCLIGENIENGYFQPDVSKESVFALLFAFFDGLFKCLTFSKCYGLNAPNGVTFAEVDLPDALAFSILALLKTKEFL